jgi:hypothetical protein
VHALADKHEIADSWFIPACGTFGVGWITQPTEAAAGMAAPSISAIEPAAPTAEIRLAQRRTAASSPCRIPTVVVSLPSRDTSRLSTGFGRHRDETGASVK